MCSSDLDDEFALFSVVIFRRVHDEFIQKCRDNKYIVRDFVYSGDEVTKQRSELENADVTEKELWVSHSLSTVALKTTCDI